ncbi:Na(+)/H(+) antiporter subunit B [Sporohalobacter salinus]|uniref:Na(+)/H(+) antiporter subunit B n=1 Tax=Sporohalobacter salinus TaxID=1494606 RepID=UPI001961DDE9|nr:hydrogenase subunit MbhD domain-containing protein [Sporohalobacter salinus]MBM7625056.1 putative MnhB-related membrane protein [Sporohalobacter salinus]
MVNNITLLLLFLLTVSALIATQIKDLLAAVVVFGAYSLIMSIIWQQMRAPDLAITEAVVGIVISVMFVVLISRTERWEE